MTAILPTVGGSEFAWGSILNAYLNERADADFTLTYSASMIPDSSNGTRAIITVNNGTAFTIGAPVNAPYTGRPLTFFIKNTSGGVMGTVTWDSAYHLAGSFTNPATGFNRSITFIYDGAGTWHETSRVTADVAN